MCFWWPTATRRYAHSAHVEQGDKKGPENFQWVPEWRANEANLITSELENGNHMPVIDIDNIPVHLVPSSHPNHYHLYINKEMSWFRYRLLLRVLVFCGVVDKRYYKNCLKRKRSQVRPFWVKKPEGAESSGAEVDVSAIIDSLPEKAKGTKDTWAQPQPTRYIANYAKAAKYRQEDLLETVKDQLI